MITRALLDEVLEELAEDPEGILRSTGIKGSKGSCASCPVAQYLHETFPAASWVGVDGNVATVDNTFAYLPDSIRDFIAYFDNDLFPELEI